MGRTGAEPEQLQLGGRRPAGQPRRRTQPGRARAHARLARPAAVLAEERQLLRIPLPASSAELAQQSSDYKTASENCLGVPRCAGVTLWGVTDKYSWVPGTFSGYGAALPYNESYAAKPAYTGLSNGLNPNA